MTDRPASRLEIYQGDNLVVLEQLGDRSIDLVYIDPPFNTGRTRSRVSLRTVEDENGDRTGFKGRRYRTERLGDSSYEDSFDDYLAFLEPRLVQARRVLKGDGSLFFHIDYREVHYCKVLLDSLFGRRSFMNEIIWAYDYGARTKSRWPAKHDTILWYAKDPDDYQFHLEECDRIPYMAPSLVGPEKAGRGKTPTDTWWMTIVSPTGREKTGYPTQKPVALLERIVRVHSRPGDVLLDFFAGSGSFGEAAWRNDRHCILVDDNPGAIDVMKKRFRDVPVVWHECGPRCG
jgi:site-specific DNA-methyltransferase (adenine-specific)